MTMSGAATSTIEERLDPSAFVPSKDDVVLGRKGGQLNNFFVKTISKWSQLYKETHVNKKREIVECIIKELLQGGTRFLLHVTGERYVVATDRKQISDVVMRAICKVLKGARDPKSMKGKLIMPKPPSSTNEGEMTMVQQAAAGRRKMSSHLASKASSKTVTDKQVAKKDHESSQVKLQGASSLNFNLSDACMDGMISSLLEKEDGMSFASEHPNSTRSHLGCRDHQEVELVPQVPKFEVFVPSPNLSPTNHLKDATSKASHDSSGTVAHASFDTDNVSQMTDQASCYGGGTGGGAFGGVANSTPVFTTRDSHFIPPADALNEGCAANRVVFESPPNHDGTGMLDQSTSFGIGLVWAEDEDEDEEDHHMDTSSVFGSTMGDDDFSRHAQATNETIVTQDSRCASIRPTPADATAQQDHHHYHQLSIDNRLQIERLEQKMERNLYTSCMRVFARLDKRVNILKQENVELRDQLESHKLECQGMRERVAILEYTTKVNTASSSLSKSSVRSGSQW